MCDFLYDSLFSNNSSHFGWDSLAGGGGRFLEGRLVFVAGIGVETGVNRAGGVFSLFSLASFGSLLRVPRREQYDTYF